MTSSSTYSTGTSTASGKVACIYIIITTQIHVSTATPSPTGLVDQSSSAGAIAAGVLIPVVVLSLLVATAVVMVVIYRKPKGVYISLCCVLLLLMFCTYFRTVETWG